MQEKTYIAIDLKSFYASVECVERGLDPLTANLVVADESRTEKTICLAVSPSLKSYGIPGRARLFEVVQKVREVNRMRVSKAPGMHFTGKSYMHPELLAHPELELTYIVAKPQMAKYMQVSNYIFQLYMRHVSPEDIHVYSVDEVFIDATPYLNRLHMTAREFTMMLIREVLDNTGITATAGIGPNLYLCKIAMDIEAKHIPADKDGVRIAELDEISYRQKLWSHRPLTDFWRVGKGYTNRLEQNGLYTMGDVARCSLENEELLYRLFGVAAELLIDHAWGYEPCTIADIHAYRPENSSLSSGQVLSDPYPYEKGKLIVKEMTDSLVLDLVEKKLETDQLVLTVCYDTKNLTDYAIRRQYNGPVTTDRYGRDVPKDAHGSINIGRFTASTQLLTDAMMTLFERIVNPLLLIRRVYVVANHVMPENAPHPAEGFEQLDMFTDYAALEKKRKEEEERLAKEKEAQKAILNIRKKYGKNAILKGMNFEEGATMAERNGQVGGHKA